MDRFNSIQTLHARNCEAVADVEGRRTDKWCTEKDGWIPKNSYVEYGRSVICFGEGTMLGMVYEAIRGSSLLERRSYSPHSPRVWSSFASLLVVNPICTIIRVGASSCHFSFWVVRFMGNLDVAGDVYGNPSPLDNSHLARAGSANCQSCPGPIENPEWKPKETLKYLASTEKAPKNGTESDGTSRLAT